MACVCLIASGCQDVDWGREWQWWNPAPRRLRPTRTTYPPRSARPAPHEQASRPRSEPGPTAEVHPQRPTARDNGHGNDGINPPTAEVHPQRPAAPTEAPPVEEGGLFRLELFSIPSELRRESNINRLKLARARASDVAAIIEMLLPGMGRGGSDDRHYVLYQSETVWRLASHFADLADVAPVQGIPDKIPATAAEAFGTGVGMVYTMLRPGRREAKRVLRAEALFNTAAQSEAAERPLRWASAMLAGKLLSAARFDRFDFEGARKHFLVAQTYSHPTSFPHMAALYARAETYEQAGQPEEARKLRERINADFTQLASSTLYQQVHRALAKSR